LVKYRSYYAIKAILMGIVNSVWYGGENDTEMTEKYEGKSVMEKYVFGDYTVEFLET